MPSLIVRHAPEAEAEADADASGARAATEPSAMERFRSAASQRVTHHGVDAIVLVTLLVWLIPLTHGFGGRDPGILTLGLVILLPALVVSGIGSLPRRHLLALFPGGGAFVAVLFSPRRGDGLDEAATWLVAGLLYLIVAAWLKRGGNAALVGIVVFVACLDQFFSAWWPWFGVGDTSSLMRGTFFWHNQFAAFMIGCGLLAAAVFLLGTGRVRALAAPVFIASAAGTYFSGSRACLAILALGCLVTAGLAWRSWRRLGQFAALGAGTVLFAWILTSSLLMPVAASASGFAARDQSVVGNGMARLEYWKSALNIARENLFVGTGADSFGTAGMVNVGNSATRTTLVHNGFLQAFVDGGIVLGGSVLACALVVLLIAVRVIWSAFRHDGAPERVWEIGAALGVGALMLHAAVDFDWSYPSLLVLAAVLTALVVHPAAGAPSNDVAPDERSVAHLPDATHRRHASVLVAVALAVVFGLAGSGAQDAAAPTDVVPGWRTVATFGVAADDGRVRAPAAIRPVSECLDELRRWTAAGPVSDPPIELMTCTASSARMDPWTVVVRASALAKSGDLMAAEAMAAPAVARMAPLNAGFALVPVELALLAERPDLAAQRLDLAGAAITATGTPRDLAELNALRLQIDRHLPMTTQGTSRGSAVGVQPFERGMR